MLDIIPRDVIGVIFEYLDLRSLARLSLVSQKLYSHVEKQYHEITKRPVYATLFINRDKVEIIWTVLSYHQVGMEVLDIFESEKILSTQLISLINMRKRKEKDRVIIKKIPILSHLINSGIFKRKALYLHISYSNKQYTIQRITNERYRDSKPLTVSLCHVIS